ILRVTDVTRRAETMSRIGRTDGNLRRQAEQKIRECGHCRVTGHGLVDQAVARAVESERAAQGAVLALIGVRTADFAAEFEIMLVVTHRQIVNELEQRAVSSRSSQVISKRLAARAAKTRHANDGQPASEFVLDYAVRQSDARRVDHCPVRNRVALAIQSE